MSGAREVYTLHRWKQNNNVPKVCEYCGKRTTVFTNKTIDNNISVILCDCCGKQRKVVEELNKKYEDIKKKESEIFFKYVIKNVPLLLYGGGKIQNIDKKEGIKIDLGIPNMKGEQLAIENFDGTIFVDGEEYNGEILSEEQIKFISDVSVGADDPRLNAPRLIHTYSQSYPPDYIEYKVK